MGAIADSLFSALMSWVRALVGDIWAIFSSERTTILEFLGKHWIGIVLVLLAVGLAADWLVWILRWQPYRLWAQRARRILHIAAPEEEEAPLPRARAARMPERPARPQPAPARDDWFPLPEQLDEEDARIALSQAESVPDASLAAYPGMRYDENRPAAQPTSDTQRFSSVRSEGPGAAEVARRRAEIDSWRQYMQDEARAKAEEARREQERYQREVAEYEQKRAQYERDLAEYERKKAEYNAQMARLAAQDGGAAQGDARREG